MAGVSITCCLCGGEFDERTLGGGWLDRRCPLCGGRLSEEVYDAAAADVIARHRPQLGKKGARALARLARGRFYTSEWFRLACAGQGSLAADKGLFGLEPGYDYPSGTFTLVPADEDRSPEGGWGASAEYFVFDVLRREVSDPASPLHGARLLPALVFPWLPGQKPKQWGARHRAETDCVIMCRSCAVIVEVKRRNHHVRASLDMRHARERTEDGSFRTSSEVFEQVERGADSFAERQKLYPPDRIFKLVVFVDPLSFGYGGGRGKTRRAKVGGGPGSGSVKPGSVPTGPGSGSGGQVVSGGEVERTAKQPDGAVRMGAAANSGVESGSSSESGIEALTVHGPRARAGLPARGRTADQTESGGDYGGGSAGQAAHAAHAGPVPAFKDGWCVSWLDTRGAAPFVGAVRDLAGSLEPLANNKKVRDLSARLLDEFGNTKERRAGRIVCGSRLLEGSRQRRTAAFLRAVERECANPRSPLHGARLLTNLVCEVQVGRRDREARSKQVEVAGLLLTRTHAVFIETKRWPVHVNTHVPFATVYTGDPADGAEYVDADIRHDWDLDSIHYANRSGSLTLLNYVAKSMPEVDGYRERNRVCTLHVFIDALTFFSDCDTFRQKTFVGYWKGRNGNVLAALADHAASAEPIMSQASLDKLADALASIG